MRLLLNLSLAVLLSFALFTPVVGDDWPQFRGPSGQGHATGKGYALTWSESENVTWKSPVPGLGWSSPSIVGNQIWLTSGVDDGKSLHAICVDRASGKIVHDVEVFTKEEPGKIHKKNSHASPSALIDGNRVFVHYGAHGTACLSTDGKIVWKTVLEYDHRHGPSGSPVLYKNLLIINCDGFETQYVVALNKENGEIVWKEPRKARHAYSTPEIIHVDGHDELMSIGADAAIAYEPLTGKEIWRVTYNGYSNVPRPVVGHGLVFLGTGYDKPTLIAVKLGGKGDITESHIAWKQDKAAPLNPSPVLVGDLLYMVSDNGIGTCVEAKTGEKVWQERLGGNYSASLVHAEDRIYFTDEDGKTIVAATGKEYKELAKNQLEGRTLATPTFVDGVIFLRTDTHLYRIENKRK